MVLVYVGKCMFKMDMTKNEGELKSIKRCDNSHRKISVSSAPFFFDKKNKAVIQFMTGTIHHSNYQFCGSN
jgi:hypothetical protein